MYIDIMPDGRSSRGQSDITNALSVCESETVQHCIPKPRPICKRSGQVWQAILYTTRTKCKPCNKAVILLMKTTCGNNFLAAVAVKIKSYPRNRRFSWIDKVYMKIYHTNLGH